MPSAALAPAAQARPASSAALVTTTVGVADQSGATFSDPLFSALGVHNARLNLAWDAMDYDWQLAELDNWMARAHAAGVQPLVIFSQSRVPGKTRLLPTSAQFSKVVDALRARYPFVTDFAAWNEANHAGQPSFKRPAAVAQFYKILRTKCPTCNVLPASLLDNPNLVPWTLKLRKAILKLGQPEPRIWGLHNYSDVNRLKDTSTRALLAAVKGKVWITESGGVVSRDQPDGVEVPAGRGLRRQGGEVHPRPADQGEPAHRARVLLQLEARGHLHELGLRPRLGGRPRAPRLPGDQERRPGRRRACSAARGRRSRRQAAPKSSSAEPSASRAPPSAADRAPAGRRYSARRSWP